MPQGVSPTGQPIQNQLPPGYYKGQDGRIFNAQGVPVDPRTGQPIASGVGQNPMPQGRAQQAQPSRPLPGGQQLAAPPAQQPQQRPQVPAGPPPNPGPQKAHDQYGDSYQNSNAAGVQSNGDDDPWSIGAFTGGTYRPDVMQRLAQRADAGDPKAAWVLDKVGFKPGMTPDQWAQSRQLSTRDEGFGQGGKWYTDPGQAGRPQAPAPQGQPGGQSDMADQWDPGRMQTDRGAGPMRDTSPGPDIAKFDGDPADTGLGQPGFYTDPDPSSTGPGRQASADPQATPDSRPDPQALPPMPSWNGDDQANKIGQGLKDFWR